MFSAILTEHYLSELITTHAFRINANMLIKMLFSLARFLKIVITSDLI